MEWIERLPWWAKYAFAGGVGLMGAFASNILPPNWQDYGFWAGVALCAFAVIGSGWHLWRSRPRPGLAAASILPDRMSLTEFRDEAARHGWDFTSDKSLHIIDFVKGIRQAALDGAIPMWARRNHPGGFEFLNSNEPLRVTPINYWKDWEIDGTSLLGADDNLIVCTWSASGKPQDKIVDLHVGRKPAMQWLFSDAKKLRGKTKG